MVQLRVMEPGVDDYRAWYLGLEHVRQLGMQAARV